MEFDIEDIQLEQNSIKDVANVTIHAHIELIAALKQGEWPPNSANLLKKAILDLAAVSWSSSSDQLILATPSHIVIARGFHEGADYHVALDLDDITLGCHLVALHPVQHGSLFTASSFADAVSHPPEIQIRIAYHASKGSIVGQMIETEFFPVRVQGPLLVGLDLLKPLLDRMGKKHSLWTHCHGAILDEFNPVFLHGKSIPSSDILMRVNGLAPDTTEKVQVQLPLHDIFKGREHADALPTKQTYTFFFKRRKLSSTSPEIPRPVASTSSMNRKRHFEDTDMLSP